MSGSEVKPMDEKTRLFAANLLIRYGRVKENMDAISAELSGLSQEINRLMQIHGNFQLSVEPIVDKKLTLVEKPAELKDGDTVVA